MGIWGSYAVDEGFVSGVELLESWNEDWRFGGVSGVELEVFGIRIRFCKISGVGVGCCGWEGFICGMRSFVSLKGE